jgi:hypothetical protein
MAFTETLEKDEEREKREAFLNELRGGGRVEKLAADMLAEDLKLKRERDSERLKYDKEFEHTENQLSIAESELAKARAGRPTPLAFPTEEETEELGGHPKNISAALGLTPKERTSDQNAALKKYRSKQGAEAQKRKVAEREELDAYIAKKEKPAESKVAREKRFLFDIKRGDKKLEEVFSPEDLKKYRERKDSDWKIFLAAEASRTAAANNAARTRLGRSEYAKAIEEDPITKTDKLLQTFSLGFLNPADQKQFAAAGRAGNAVADFDAAIKLDRATSSAKSASVERALSSGQIGNIADVTAGWASATNRAFRASEVVAGRLPASFRILNLPLNATVEKQDATMQNTLRLAHLGNTYAQMDVAALAAVAKATAAFQKTKSDAAATALVKETDRAAAEQGNHYKALGAEYAASASVEGGRFSMESLSPDLKAVAYIGDPKDNILSVKGGYILSGGQGFLTAEAVKRSTDVSEQLTKGASTVQALLAMREALTGVEGIKWGNLTRSQQFNLTNPANIVAAKEELDAIKAYREASGVQPPHFANAARHRDEVVAMKINAEEELASIDKELGDPSTSATQRAALIGKRTWMNLGLGGLNRNVQKAESEVISAISDMKRDTADMKAETTAGKKRKETKEMALWDMGQKNIELFRKHIAANAWEQQNRARPLEGKMQGLTAYEWTFFETDAEGKPIDVRDVFKPWLTMRTQSATGGMPDDPRDDVVVLSPNWGTRVSNGLFWDKDTLSNRRIIDAEKKIYPIEDGPAVQEYFEQREAYRTAQAEWNLENNPKTTSTPSRAEVLASTPPTAPALTTAAEPLTVPMAPADPADAPAALNIPVSPELAKSMELVANKLMKGVTESPSGVPYKNNERVRFSDPRYPDSVQGRWFFFKLDKMGNPYWLLDNERAGR